MNKFTKFIFYLFIIITAILGLLYYLNPVSFIQTSYQNALTLKNSMMDHTLDCPNYLKKEGTQILLYDLNKPVSNTNPIVFTSLADYDKYIEEKSKEGIHCPILELESEPEPEPEPESESNFETEQEQELEATIFNKEDYHTIDTNNENKLNYII